jgi:hypothetical protein
MTYTDVAIPLRDTWSSPSANWHGTALVLEVIDE